MLVRLTASARDAAKAIRGFEASLNRIGDLMPKNYAGEPALLYGEPISEANARGLRDGILTVNEVREREGLAPLDNEIKPSRFDGAEPDPPRISQEARYWGGSTMNISYSTAGPAPWDRQRILELEERAREIEAQEAEERRRSEESARRKLLRPKGGRRILVREEDKE